MAYDFDVGQCILALLPIGPALHSISSNFCTCIFTWSCSTRTELVQKWSLLVRIRTSMERISICFFEPGDLRFRPDSGQMVEDLDEVLLVQLNQTISAQEELQQARGQSEEDLIYLSYFSSCLWAAQHQCFPIVSMLKEEWWCNPWF